MESSNGVKQLSSPIQETTLPPDYESAIACFPNADSIIDATVGMTLLLENLFEHHRNCHGANGDGFRA